MDIEQRIQAALDRASRDPQPHRTLPRRVKSRARWRAATTLLAITAVLGGIGGVSVAALSSIGGRGASLANAATSQSARPIVFSLATSVGGPSSIIALNPDGTSATLQRDLPDVAGLAVSPDGTQIVYSASDHSGYNIYTLSMAGGTPTQLTSGNAVDAAPAWSPDGLAIAFQSNRDDMNAGVVGERIVNDIFVIPAGGGDPINLTKGDTDDAQPAWSPDGRLIAFASDRAGSYDLFSMGVDGTGVQTLTSEKGTESDPAWAPDGSQIAFVSTLPDDSDARISLLDIASGSTVDLTDPALAATNPVWSEDAETIVFIANGTTDEGALLPETAIYSMSRSGTDITRLSLSLGFDNGVGW